MCVFPGIAFYVSLILLRFGTKLFVNEGKKVFGTLNQFLPVMATHL